MKVKASRAKAPETTRSQAFDDEIEALSPTPSAHELRRYLVDET
jgi:hypothetical protein